MKVEIYGQTKTHSASGQVVRFTADSTDAITSFSTQIELNGVNGYDEVVVYRNGTEQSVPLGKTVYAGSANITSGALTETYGGGAYDPNDVPNEVENEIKNKLPVQSESGAMLTFDCSLGEFPVKSMSVQITPQQSGSGDPSPDNVRPISGWTGATIQRTGKNLFDKNNYQSFKGYFLGMPTGAFVSGGTGRDVVFIKCSAGQTYTVSRLKTADNERFRLCFSKEPPDAGVQYFNAISAESSGQVGDLMTMTATAPADAVYLCVWAWWGFSVDPQESLQIEVGATASAYEPYKGNTYPISWETEVGTVYGGTLDVNTGTLTARPYYASYAGEALVGPWISSMDVYAEGAVPTTGAQVLDLGGTAQTYQLTPQQVNTMLGVNNIWADTGDSSVSYYDGNISDTTILAETSALISGQKVVYPLAEPRTSTFASASVPTVVGENIMSSNAGPISVTWTANWFDITPWIAWQGLTFSRNDVDSPDAGRDLGGLMHRGRVAVKEKMNIQTIQLTRAQTSELQTLLYPETIRVRVTPHPQTNSTRVMSMYANNVKTTYVIHRENGEDLQSLSFPLIEN